MRKDFASQYRDLVQWHWWFRGREKILRSVIAATLDGYRPRSICLLGCGPAEGARWVLQIASPDARIVGIDIDATQTVGSNSFLSYVVGSAEDPPVRPGSFDLVLALDVMEHLDDDVRGLEEAVALLEKGGLLVVTVPAIPSLWGDQDIVSSHRRRYTKRSLLSAFSRARLDRPRVTYFNAFLFPPIAAVRWTRRLARAQAGSRSDFDGSRPGFVNDVLTRIFGSEAMFVQRMALPIGASLLAVLQKRSL